MTHWLRPSTSCISIIAPPTPALQIRRSTFRSHAPCCFLASKSPSTQRRTVRFEKAIPLRSSNPTATFDASNPVPRRTHYDPLTVMMQMWYCARAVCFVFLSLAVSAALLCVMVCAMPYVLLFDRYRRGFYAHINTLWAKTVSFLFYGVQVEGHEYLPSSTEPAVYVSNHQSFLDILALFFLDRPFKFISKSTVFLFPFIGWSMFLTGHVPLKRTDPRSQIKCLKDCQYLLEKGASVMFFPEGTRSADQNVQPFKKGAFTVAVRTGVPIVPVAVVRTGDLMPKGKEFQLKHGKVRVIVHPRIESKDRDADQLRKEAEQVIKASV